MGMKREPYRSKTPGGNQRIFNEYYNLIEGCKSTHCLGGWEDLFTEVAAEVGYE